MLTRKGDRGPAYGIDEVDPLVGECGFTPPAAEALRNALASRAAACWRSGDLLLAQLGPPPEARAASKRDGSYARLAKVADVVGLAVPVLASWRNVSAAWPLAHRRRECSWGCHRAVYARPDRRELLTAFLNECRAERVNPGRPRLEAWLAARDGDASAVVRPLVDPVDRVLRLALRLDHDELVALVARLSQAIEVAPAA